MENAIRVYALHNAVKYGGKANPKALVGKIMGEFPDARKDMTKTLATINKIVDNVNSMSEEDQLSELKKLAPEMLEEKKHEKKGLKPLPKDERKVVMRFEPSPSGPLHIGHAYPAALNYAYTKEYNGKMILRISDTNPDNIDPDAYNLIKEDGDWLFGKGNYEFYIQSERIERYYEAAKELLEKDTAYICTCDSEVFRNLLNNKEACPCRNLGKEKQLLRWEKMFSSFKQGEAVMRFKSDIEHKNPAMRDFPLMRINENTHPKTANKYRVWPLMNFSVSIDDMDYKITHTLRGKDHADNAKRQAMVHEVFNYKTPNAISVGRINFEGFPVSCSKTKELIKEGKVSGWDDISIPFLLPLRKRGYIPEAVTNYAIEVGVTQTDKTVKIEDYFKSLNALNKSILDAKTKRFFFVRDPVKIKIENAPVQKVELDFHPDKEKGGRKFKTGENFYITKEDFENIRLREDNELFRLMDCINFKKDNDKFVFDSQEYEKYKENGSFIIHWLPEEKVDVEVLMPDKNIVKGYGEKTLDVLKEGDIVQLERFGFCRLEKKGEKFLFWFGHK